jgi:peptidoglycan/xylan/chitin deacetylase (PgdA/CDA1 family)
MRRMRALYGLSVVGSNTRQGSRLARAAAKAALVRLTAAAAARRREPHDGLAILYWHRVGPGLDVLAVSPRSFRRACDEIERSGSRIVDLADLETLVLAPAERALALTFDDGYADLLDHAIPEITRRGWPATVFVVPGAVDGDVRFDDVYRPDRHPAFIGWDEMLDVERLSAVRFEAHSLTHRDLPSLDDATARDEIVGCADVLARRLGRPARLFCYPRGYFGERERDLCAIAGYRAAVGTEYGVNRLPFDRFGLRRTIFDGLDDRLLMRARLRGFVDEPPPLRTGRSFTKS